MNNPDYIYSAAETWELLSKLENSKKYATCKEMIGTFSMMHNSIPLSIYYSCGQQDEWNDYSCCEWNVEKEEFIDEYEYKFKIS
jgi:hypothetical protein